MDSLFPGRHVPGTVKYSTTLGLGTISDLCNYRAPRLTGTERAHVRLVDNISCSEAFALFFFFSFPPLCFCYLSLLKDILFHVIKICAAIPAEPRLRPLCYLSLRSHKAREC